MRAFFIILLIWVTNRSYSQGEKMVINDQSFNIQVLNPLLFTYNSADELLERKVVPNVLELKLKAQRGYNIYVSVQPGSVYGQSFINNRFSLLLANKASRRAIVSKQEFLLTQQPQLLIMLPGMAGDMEEISLIYNMAMHPLETFVNPGHYNFSIIFTMTPQ